MTEASLGKQLDKALRDTAWDSLKAESLFQKGARLDHVPGGAASLLEDTFRDGNLHKLEWLVEHYACFDDVSCGTGRLLLDTIVSKRFYRAGKFLLTHCTRFDDVPGGWVTLINATARSLGRFGGLDQILSKAPVEALISVVEGIGRNPEERKTLPHDFYDLDGDIRWPGISQSVDPPIVMTITYLLDRLPDWTLIETQGKSITASRTLLSARSGYFEHLFKSPTLLGNQRSSFKIPKPYSVRTIQFVVSYAEVEPDKFDWSPFDLDDLMDMLLASHNFRMAELHSRAQYEITRRGRKFISLRNVPAIMHKANQAKASILLRYCEGFVKLNIPQLLRNWAAGNYA